MLYRRTGPTVPNPSTYEPSLLVIAQGRIRVDLGKASYVFGQSRFLLTSLELPVISQVITASEKAPYLAFFLKLDMSTVWDILNTEEVQIPEATSGACAMATGETTVELVNSCSRMMDLLDAPQDISFLANSFTRDHLSLTAGKSGSTPSRDCHVRDQVPPDGEGGCLVAFKLREAFACRAPGDDCRHESIYVAPPFSRPYGDESAAISKAASPACARQRILTGGLDAATAAFEVGYESPSQFNREYRRFFGQPPIRDIKALQDGKVVALRIERTLRRPSAKRADARRPRAAVQLEHLL